MEGKAERFYRHNVRLFYITEIFRSLILVIPIWVIFERQYITASQLTLLEAIICGFQLILELPTGAFADLFGKKVTVSLGYFIKSLSWFAFAAASSFYGFLIYALLNGLGEALESGAREALVYDTAKEAGKEHTVDRLNAKFNLVTQVVLAAATLAGGIIGSFSLRLPSVLYAMMLFIAAIVCLLAKEPHIDTERFTLRRYLAQTTKGVGELSRNNYITILSLYYIFVGGITWACQVLFDHTLLVDLGYKQGEIGVILSTIRILNSIIVFRLVHLEKVFTPKRAFIAFPLVMMLSLIPGVLFNKWIAIPFVAGIMIVSSGRWVVLLKYVNADFDSRNRATAISTLNMGVGILYVFFALLGGPIMDLWGGTKTVFTLLGIVTVFTALPLGIVLSRRYKPLVST